MTAWPRLVRSERWWLTRQLGLAMRALHQVPIPPDWERPDLRPNTLAALVERGRLTAVLDFEMARPAAPDLELDVLLRFCNWPRLPVAPEEEHLMQREDFRPVPEWLAGVYAELFGGPRLSDRLEVYAVMHDLRQSIQFPERPGEPEWRPVQGLRAIVDGRSYLREILPG